MFVQLFRVEERKKDEIFIVFAIFGLGLYKLKKFMKLGFYGLYLSEFLKTD